MLNIVTLIGRLVRDPEVRTTDKGKILTKFSVAVPRNKQKTDFISCIAWDEFGQYIERHFRKGDYIGVAGCLQIEAYTTKHGDRASKATVVVDRFSFCGSSYSDVDHTAEQDPSEREESASVFDVHYDEPDFDEVPF